MTVSSERSSGEMITIDDALSDGHLLHDSQRMPRPSPIPDHLAALPAPGVSVMPVASREAYMPLQAPVGGKGVQSIIQSACLDPGCALRENSNVMPSICMRQIGMM